MKKQHYSGILKIKTNMIFWRNEIISPDRVFTNDVVNAHVNASILTIVQ